MSAYNKFGTYYTITYGQKMFTIKLFYTYDCTLADSQAFYYSDLIDFNQEIEDRIKANSIIRSCDEEELELVYHALKERFE